MHFGSLSGLRSLFVVNLAEVENLANLVSSGMWAAESLHLLQRISEAFNTSLSHESRRESDGVCVWTRALRSCDRPNGG